LTLASLILQDFRCFAGRQEVPLRPVTLLVGENSSGKTSFLAAARIAEHLRGGTEPPDFNEEPFSLGAYDELANFRGGKAGRPESFIIGSQYTRPPVGDRNSLLVTNTAEFGRSRAQPALTHYVLKGDSYAFEVIAGEDLTRVTVRTPHFPHSLSLVEDKLPITPWASIHVYRAILGQNISLKGELDAEERQQLTHLAGPLPSYLPPYAAAPIRAQPKRTYELLSDEPRPQGDHVPILLAQIYGQQQWEELVGPLEAFARAAGLFEAISVRRLGKSESSPFQIHVKLGGPPRNLVDVGYGVSQILPLLVDLLRDRRRRMYLIQQPEVHLHPRAQAELGPLFGAIATKTHDKQLLIETHSDYLIDRVRMEVRDKKLKPSDIIVLYFERSKGNVIIHPLKLDDWGNLLNVPPSYRQFFLEEEKRFLGVG
jgi:predicted ATPase